MIFTGYAPPKTPPRLVFQFFFKNTKTMSSLLDMLAELDAEYCLFGITQNTVKYDEGDGALIGVLVVDFFFIVCIVGAIVYILYKYIKHNRANDPYVTKLGLGYDSYVAAIMDDESDESDESQVKHRDSESAGIME